MPTIISSDTIQRFVGKISDPAGPSPARIEGIPDAFKALLISALSAGARHPLLVLSPTPEEAEKLIGDLQFFFSITGREDIICYFPALEIVPYEQVDPPPALVADRTRTLQMLGKARNTGNIVVVATAQAVLSPLPDPDRFNSAALKVKMFESLPKEDFLENLDRLGFSGVSLVENPGEYSHRGGIIDFWPAVRELPVRLEYDGDLVESLRTFNPFDQRSVSQLEEVFISPVLNKKGDWGEKRAGSLLAAVGNSAFLVLDEPAKFERELLDYEGMVLENYAQSLEAGREILPPQKAYLSAREILKEMDRLRILHLQGLKMEDSAKKGGSSFSFSVGSPGRLGLGIPGQTFQKITELIEPLRRRAQIVLSCHTETQVARLLEICAAHHLPASRMDLPLDRIPEPPAPLLVISGTLSSGFQSDDLPVAFVTEEDLFGKPPRTRAPARRKGRSFFSSLEELKVSDLVVHINHGIGRYLGLKRLTIEGIPSDFLTLEYAGGDKIFVPLEGLDLISRYGGPEGDLPPLDRLGGTSWNLRKQKVKKSIETMTREILDLYAAREVAKGYSFSPENEMSREFAATFDFEETPDQARAIEDVISDMENDKPMDRLICGDVGYGKTEVAMRAAFKAVKDNKQVAILVPTTLLAKQHFTNFSRRFSPFPVKVDMLSRFRSAREQKAVIKSVEEGTTDILIGTHRLLQKDLRFRDLGLLIVDEEQRFGVLHKEKIKQLKTSIDVLTLSATPIPRTLQMSLMNIRNMSVIETPPADRLAIRTVLTRFDRRILREAIRRELERDGQVFFVHNRVAGIEKIGALISELVPEAEIAIAHGQMRERELEEVMGRFISGETRILLSTTIIESGLDIPRANTIIINRADQFGLSELYQLRGRVGRSGQQAYAYLLVDPSATLTDHAQKRLKALQEFTELGAGFRIAARDLEIRGAGNFLGTSQSGEIASVGVELYVKMLETTVADLRGQAPEPEIEPKLHLGLPAFIPDEYISDSYQRLYFYKKMAGLHLEEDLSRLLEEIRDRYGPIPGELETLSKIMEIRILSRRLKVAQIDRNSQGVYFTLQPAHEISPAVIRRLSRDPKIRLIPEFSFQVLLKRETAPSEVLTHISRYLQILEGSGG